MRLDDFILGIFLKLIKFYITIKSVRYEIKMTHGISSVADPDPGSSAFLLP
jgi:hypothetical protein